MRFPMLLVVLVLSACRCDAIGDLENICPLDEPCLNTADGVVLDPLRGRRLAGECHIGRVIDCNDDGAPICSDDEVLPHDNEEVCGDGVDNDCDGQIDEVVYYPDDPRNTCPAVGACVQAYQRCVFGAMACEYTHSPTEEVCNCVDDDCDGEVDEGLDGDTYFYPDNLYPGTAGVGACRIGISRCQACGAVVVPPVTPVAEARGDCVDNDCDGLIDEDEDSTETRAFAIVLDTSGSMSNEHSSIVTAICAWSQNALSIHTRFALVYVAYGIAPYHLTVAQDFTGAAEICALLQQPLPPGLSAGHEYMLDGVLVAGDLDWPAVDERWVLAFGDESVSAYSGNLYDADSSDVVTECVATPYNVGAFVNGSYMSEWQWAQTSCGGFVEQLDDYPGATPLEESLRGHFSGVGSTCD